MADHPFIAHFYTLENLRHIILSGLLFFFFLTTTLSLSAQRAGNNESPVKKDLNYQIALWYKFNQAAASITFDDNVRLQFTFALPLLNQHNFKGTFYIVTNWVGNGKCPGWDTLNMAAMQGHEIGSHSKNHANFVTLSSDTIYADSMRRELQGSRDSINAHVHYQNCETLGWPGGAVNDPAIEAAEKYYMACRGSSNLFNGVFPSNYYNICSMKIYHSTPVDSVNLYVHNILDYGGWLVERYHGFQVGQDTEGYEPVPIGVFHAHLDYIAQHGDSLWVSTVSNVVKYMRERDYSTLAIVDTSSSGIVMSLTNNLPDTFFHYNVPLSIKLMLNGRLDSLKNITQNGISLPLTFRTEGGEKYVYFDAVPNIALLYFSSHPTGTGNLQSTGQNSFQIYPNPSVSATTLSIDLPEPGFVNIRIYDMNGIKVKDYSRRFSSGFNKVSVDGSDLPAGVYLCRIETREKSSVLKMVLTH